MLEEKESSVIVPHPWDLWHEQQRLKHQASLPPTPIKVRTALSEVIEVDPNEISRWSWSGRYLTSDCGDCPLNIPQDQASRVAVELGKRPQLKGKIPAHHQGICAYGQTFEYGQKIFKFLVQNQHYRAHGCQHPMEDRLIRADQRTERGEIRPYSSLDDG